MEETSTASEYRSALAELTANSRPIIDALTAKAKQNMANADQIARVIEERIVNVESKYKLPTMYLLDSIVKVVGGRYVPEFAKNLETVYNTAYYAVDNKVRHSLSRLVPLWAPIFPQPVIANLTRFLEEQQPRTIAPVIAAPRTQVDVKPPVNYATNTVDAWSKQPVPKSTAQAHTLQQRDPLSLHGSMPLNYGMTQPQYSQSSHLQQHNSAAMMANVKQRAMSAHLIKTIQEIIAQKHTMAMLDPTNTKHSAQLMDFQKILVFLQTNILDLNQLDVFRQQITALVAQDSQVPGSRPSLPGAQAAFPIVRLETADINRYLSILIPNLYFSKRAPMHVPFLYERLTLHCKQCGLRFPDTDEGRVANTAHLDWHFRQNRKLTDNVLKSLSRDWFLNENDWLELRNVDTTSKQAPSFFETSASAGPQGDADLSKVAAVVPSIPMVDGVDAVCYVCKEKFETFWDEDEEEWMMRDAVMINGKVFHTACYEEANKSLISPTVGQSSASFAKRRSPGADTIGDSKKIRQ